MTRGQKIKFERESHNLSQTEFANIIGVSKQTLYKYENDLITNIPSDVIEKMAHYLECSPAYFFGWEDKTRIKAISQRLSKLSPTQLDDIEQYLEFIEKRGEPK